MLAEVGQSKVQEILTHKNSVSITKLRWKYPEAIGVDIRLLVEVIGTCLAPLIYGLTKGTWQVQLEHFVHCTLTGEEPRMTGEDATEALRLSLAAGQSAREGRVIQFPVV